MLIRRLIRCFPLLLGLALTTPAKAADGIPVGAKLVKIFIVAGQSNAVGRAPGDELPKQYRVAPSNVQFDYICSLGASQAVKPDVTIAAEPHTSNGWVPLQPQPRHLSTPGTHFGPELSLGYILGQTWPSQLIGLIKHGRGATSLAEDWPPDATTGKRLYPEMLVQIRRALANLKAEGATAELSAFIWCRTL